MEKTRTAMQKREREREGNFVAVLMAGKAKNMENSVEIP